LAQLLLVGDTSKMRESLVAALAIDPPLVLWTVGVAAQSDGFQPCCLGDVGVWLTRHALEVLQWGPSHDDWPPESDTFSVNAYADRVAARLQVADLAQQLAVAEGQSSSELAQLLGLLGDAADWPASTDGPAAENECVSACLPLWLVEADHTPAREAVQLATAVLAGEAPLPDAATVDLDACRRRATKASRRWTDSVASPGRWLPALTAKLARLAALENSFDETMELEKLEAIAEFAAGAGHEINNPLTVIAGRAQLFLREEKDPERRRALALMNTQAKRVYEMIADMMLFARPPKPEPRAVDLVDLIERLLEEVAPHADRQDTALCRTGDDGPLEVELDGTQLTVALRAMCQNSLEAIGRQGQIEIGVHGRDSDVEIRVSDDGPGLTPEERRHVFDPYYSARQAGRGLGLGLSKAWRIVTNHGGRITVESRPGQGAVFTIVLPRRNSTSR